MSEQNRTPENGNGVSRRKALARLGLTAVAAYSAPSLMKLDRAAQAGVLPSFCPPPGGGNGNGNGNGQGDGGCGDGGSGGD